MASENIRKMVETSKRHKFSVEVEKFRKILDSLGPQEKSNAIVKIEYWKAE